MTDDLAAEARALFCARHTQAKVREIRHRAAEIEADLVAKGHSPEHAEAVSRFWLVAAGVLPRTGKEMHGVKHPPPGNKFWKYPKEAAE